MNKPTCEELWDEELESVSRKTDDAWRHGVYVDEVFFREADTTYWQASYQRSTDGETNGLRDGMAKITQVEQYEYIAKGFRPV